MIFVTGRGKSALEDYFDAAFELETTMREKGKSLDMLERSRARFGEIVAVRQQQPLGLGHAVWCARDIVGDEPFAVLLPDDLMVPGALKPMVEAWEQVGGNLVATEEVAEEKTSSYGIITPGETTGDLAEVRGLVEKPDPAKAPSRMGVIGRYILQPEVMRVLDAGEKGAGGEIQLTDAMAKLIGTQPFHALNVRSVRHDCGDKAGFVIANLAMALQRDDVGPKVRDFIRTL
jgi:UTP--glucose-1-phosphate uridylyltransferase